LVVQSDSSFIKALTPRVNLYDELEAEFDAHGDIFDGMSANFDSIKMGLSHLHEKKGELIDSVMKVASKTDAAMIQARVEDAIPRRNRELVSRQLAIDDDGYNNPDDTYTPSNNVNNGAAISGVDFDVSDTEYISTVLVKPILLFVLGFLSLFFLNLGLCCRCCCKCCRCLPNDHHTEKGHDHDSHEKREKYINHQKMMVTAVEMLLIFSVLLADTLCFYGYTYLQSGTASLNEAFDMLLVIMKEVQASCLSLKDVDTPGITASKNAAKISCSVASGVLANLDEFCDTLATTSETLYDTVTKLVDYIELGQTYVNDFLAANLRTFVFLIWCFAAVATGLFLLFRICRSECGTKFAIFWGELTFFLILLINLPLMVFTQILGDFCVQPTANILGTLGAGDMKEMVYYYSHCVGNDTIGEALLAVKGAMTDINNATSVLKTFCPSGTAGYDDLTDMDGYITDSGSRFAEIADSISCENFQAVWFKLMNDAFCGGFYSGVYSLWVSQFITSFFLFFLIVTATVSYQYFKKTDKLVVPDAPPIDDEKPVEASQYGQPGTGEDEEAYEGYNGASEDPAVSKVGGGGEYEMAPMEGGGDEEY
jgi:hypothetical protein